jgi:hypothetical protein
MAAADVLQRLLDAGANRIANVGTPTTANDATFTDNSTAPSNPAGAAVAGASFLAAPANHVHQAVHSIHADANAQIFGDIQLVSGSGIALSQVGNVVTVATGAGATNKVTWGDDSKKYSSTNTEDLLAEYAVSFDDAGVGNIQARITGIISVGAGTGTYRMYTGATTPGSTTGGTIRATISTASVTEVLQQNLGSAFANPTGVVLVQITGQNSTTATKSNIRGMVFSIG